MWSPVFWKCLIRWLVMIALLITWHPHTQSNAVQAAHLVALALLFVSGFVWPRCPHCGARVVRINTRDWLPGLNCHVCGRPYAEPPTPRNVGTGARGA